MPPQDPEQARWFSEEVRPHEPKLRAWLRSRFSMKGDVDDVLQDAYVRILRERERRKIESPKAFLFAVARNLAIDHLRRRNALPTESLVENEECFVMEQSDDSAGSDADDQKRLLLTQAIQALPKRCRQIFTLRKVYGLSQREIAAMLSVSEHTVSAQLTIGLHKCAEYVARRRAGGMLES